MADTPAVPTPPIPRVDLDELLARASRTCRSCNGAGMRFVLPESIDGEAQLLQCNSIHCIRGRTLPPDLAALYREVVARRATIDATIVRDLATGREPLGEAICTETGRWIEPCALCESAEPAHEFEPGIVHKPTCPWRQARERHGEGSPAR